MFRLWMRALFSPRGMDAAWFEEEEPVLVEHLNADEFYRANSRIDRLSEVVGVVILLLVLAIYCVALLRGGWPMLQNNLLIVAMMASGPVAMVRSRPRNKMSVRSFRATRITMLILPIVMATVHMIALLVMEMSR